MRGRQHACSGKCRAALSRQRKQRARSDATAAARRQLGVIADDLVGLALRLAEVAVQLNGEGKP